MKEQSALHEMFRLQEELNIRVGCNIPVIRIDPASQDEWIQKFSRAIGQENGELLDSTGWKWWRKSQTFDPQNAKVEVIDLFHFIISAAQVLGMSADDVFEAYLKKNAVNHQRQDAGYVVKDENDCRHI
jgi:dimeric dUTPase (all-alpha-NTP-PPase superfamily)